MDELKKRLQKELIHNNPNTKIIKSQEWFLPVQVIEITFETVKRSKMDILMKMILLTCQKAKIKSSKELSELLLVEPLFIKDLITKMLATKMLEQQDGTFSLTKYGIQQLNDGIFISEQTSQLTSAMFSMNHQKFLLGKLNHNDKQKMKKYRYAQEDRKNQIKQSAMMQVLRTMGKETNSGTEQVVIEAITTAKVTEVAEIPCLEYQLYNETEKLVYARVWNSLLMEWDETLETQLNKKERTHWRKKLGV